MDMEFAHIRNALNVKNFTQFCDAVKSLFAGIPYNLHIARESYYHSLFHLMFDLLGMRPASEVASSGGRADMVVETVDTIIVFEFKFDTEASEALQQILERKYYVQYTRANKAIMLVGVAVNFRDKEVFFEWQEQTV